MSDIIHIGGKAYQATGKDTNGREIFERVVFNPRTDNPADKKACVSKISYAEPPPDFRLRLVITSQIRGGKNSVLTTRTGHRYPNKKWATWRDEKVSEVKAQLPAGFKTISAPVEVRLDYWSGDKRRRDMPAIIDSLFHLMERAGVVADDCLIWVTESTRSYDKQNPRAVLTFKTP